MKTVIFMRHGKSSWAEPDQSDHKRPLQNRGIKAARRIRQQLDDQGLRPDVILSSDATRTRQTVEHLGFDTNVQFLPELYLAPERTYIETLLGQEESVKIALMVGHNPGLEILVSTLCGKEIAFPTAATAVFTVEADIWQDITSSEKWTLRELWYPRELD